MHLNVKLLTYNCILRILEKKIKIKIMEQGWSDVLSSFVVVESWDLRVKTFNNMLLFIKLQRS